MILHSISSVTNKQTNVKTPNCLLMVSSANPMKNKPYYKILSLKLHNCHLSPAVGLGLGCTVDVRGGKLLLTERRCSIVVASALQQFSVATAIEKRWTWAASSTHWDFLKKFKPKFLGFYTETHFLSHAIYRHGYSSVQLRDSNRETVNLSIIINTLRGHP